MLLKNAPLKIVLFFGGLGVIFKNNCFTLQIDSHPPNIFCNIIYLFNKFHCYKIHVKIILRINSKNITDRNKQVRM